MIFSENAATICGRVLDDWSQPLRGVRATAVLKGSESYWVPPTWTTNDGKFCLKDLRAGVYTLTVNRPGYLSVQQSVSLWNDHAEVGDVTLVQEVGKLTDLSRIVIQGNIAFTERAIRSGLLSDSSIVLASHPLAPRQTYIATVERKILDGYRAKGFPNATIAAHLSPDGTKIFVDLKEGARYTKGDISVSGTHAIKIEELKKQLQEERIKSGLFEDDEQMLANLREALRRNSGNPAWSPGDTANFSEDGRQWIEGAVQVIFAEMGYWSPSISVNVVPVPGRTLAALVINVKDEGRREVIREFRVSGNKKDSAKDFLRYLDVHIGMPVTKTLLEEMQRKLAGSGRFIKYQLKTEQIEEDRTGSRLVIDVTESKYAPPLSQPLSTVEEAAVKMCDWLRRTPERGDDIVLEMNYQAHRLGDFQMIASPDGILVSTLNSNPDGTTTIRNAALLSFPLSGIFSPGIGRALAGEGIGPDKAIFGSMSLTASVKDGEEDLHTGVSGGVSGRTMAAKSYNFDIDAPAVACMVASQRKGNVARIEHGVLRVDGRNDHIVAVAATGEIREFTGRSPEDQLEIRLSLQKGALANARDQLAALPQRETSQPLSMWAGFLTQMFFDDDFSALAFEHSTATERRRAAKASGVLITEALSAFDPFVHTLVSDASFDVPPDAITNSAEAPSLVASMLGSFLFSHVNEWFTENSWPWTVFHEAVYVLSGKTQYTGLEMDRIYDSNEIGPVGFLVCAEALVRAGSPAAKEFAARGLTRLSKEEFRKDLQVVFAGNELFKQSVNNLADALRQMSDQDVEALVGLIPPNVASPIRKAVAQTKVSPTVSGTEILATVLEENWDESLRAAVEKRLNSVVTATSQSSAVATDK